MKGLISQILTIAVIVLWAAARRRASTGGGQGRRRRRSKTGGGAPRQAPTPEAAGRPRGEDVVWGARTLRHPPRSRGDSQQALSRARAADASMPSARAGMAKAASGAKTLAQGGSRYAGSLGTSAAEEVTSARRRSAPWERLGVGRTRAARQKGLRRAILLSEVIGPPRAMRGPAGRTPRSQ